MYLISIPVISSGGAGSDKDVVNLVSSTCIDAVAVASVLHYDISTIDQIKSSLNKNGEKVRL